MSGHDERLCVNCKDSPCHPHPLLSTMCSYGTRGCDVHVEERAVVSGQRTSEAFSHPKCPDCGRELDVVNEEVDIGVGIQTFAVALECHEHGGICGLCYGCGVPQLDGYEHRPWCSELKKDGF